MKGRQIYKEYTGKRISKIGLGLNIRCNYGKKNFALFWTSLYSVLCTCARVW